MRPEQQPIDVLLVEDNADDAEMLRRIANASDESVRLEVASTGEEALSRLRPTLPLPAVIFLDISLPGLSGLEFLRSAKGDPGIAEIPVILLSGSEDDEDVRIGRELEAHSHLVKPISAHDLNWVLTSVGRYQARAAALAEFR